MEKPLRTYWKRYWNLSKFKNLEKETNYLNLKKKLIKTETAYLNLKSSWSNGLVQPAIAVYAHNSIKIGTLDE